MTISKLASGLGKAAWWCALLAPAALLLTIYNADAVVAFGELVLPLWVDAFVPLLLGALLVVAAQAVRRFAEPGDVSPRTLRTAGWLAGTFFSMILLSLMQVVTLSQYTWLEPVGERCRLVVREDAVWEGKGAVYAVSRWGIGLEVAELGGHEGMTHPYADSHYHLTWVEGGVEVSLSDRPASVQFVSC